MTKTTDKGAAHIQLSGMSSYDNDRFTAFFPDNNCPGTLPTKRVHGVYMQHSNGAFEFIEQKRRRAQSTLRLKLPHGRVSHTKDNATLLTIRVADSEAVDFIRVVEEETKYLKRHMKEA